ncbi:RNA-binding S4 domain-containing protein [Chitinophaga nivalis]|uniref:RNA-binding S4 domain-containing protein n=1 Tax=Chitinophaga nivalis TaxID=2991709 RepID=A0ABT3IX15_9BACT|nr:RNA-binding S4 domain-containing protein [Chitinophaga nivalis]MCW3461817.1 RNA-binding S4 domain-containing protein [Chitinophaga nivalis]MCW3488489.1 RNA-binding S4 domain-containing protein [Chitinophaga nivalis]
MSTNEKLRVDKYLWSIRVFKTRSQASDACDGGKVKLNGATVKAAKSVNVGDKFEIRTPARKWLIEVTGLLANRAAYSEAIKYYIDNTPEEDKLAPAFTPSVFQTGKRQSKIGRPTKKDRRSIDGFMEPEEEEA